MATGEELKIMKIVKKLYTIKSCGKNYFEYKARFYRHKKLRKKDDLIVNQVLFFV